MGCTSCGTVSSNCDRSDAISFTGGATGATGATGAAGSDGSDGIATLYNDLTYKWFDGSDGTKVSSLEAGSYGLTVYDNNGCSYDTMIIIDDGRKIQYSKEFNNPYCPEIPDGSIWIKVDESPLLYEYQWSTGGEFNIIENLSQGQYFVTITDKRDDCSVVDTTFLYPDNEICIRIPNAFSPNGDGINETWDIPMLHQLYPNVEVFIFDIWGKVVFISEGYTEPWDGCTEDGYPLPVSTYYYVMELNDGRGSDITGNVLILR